jgi:hypothetical protein
MESTRFKQNKSARPLGMSFNLASCAHYTLMDFSILVELSRPLETNLIGKFARLWNVMR